MVWLGYINQDYAGEVGNFCRAHAFMYLGGYA